MECRFGSCRGTRDGGKLFGLINSSIQPWNSHRGRLSSYIGRLLSNFFVRVSKVKCLDLKMLYSNNNKFEDL